VAAQLKHIALYPANYWLKNSDMACQPIAPIPYFAIRMAV
jgi:hypothetical protein